MRRTPVTPESEASCVTALIENDLLRNRHWTRNDRLEYLELVLDKVETSIRSLPEVSSDPIGESRPEVDPSDVEISSIVSLLRDVLLTSMPPELGTFVSTSKCLRGEKARAWLYEHKFTSEHDHIHVYDDDLCMSMRDSSLAEWVEPDGVRMVGEYADVGMAMFKHYMENRR